MSAVPADQPGSEVEIAIIGAGFGGVAAAIRLSQAGYRDMVILERADAVGGTWRDNSYPGCACDVPSTLYSYSFARNPDWSQAFSGQAEIWQYLDDCVARYRLEPHLRLGHEVRQVSWDQNEQRWLVSTSRATFRARVLICACGPLAEPAVPALPGLESFAGTTFHSARWRHDHDLTGRSVAVIGTGASAVQFVPRIAGSVRRLTVFQRTAPWVLPRRAGPVGPVRRWAYRSVPGAQRLARYGQYWSREAFGLAFQRPALMRVVGQRAALAHLHRQIPEGPLREALTPDYTMGCKRVLLSDDYYRTLRQPRVELVTTGISRIEPDGIQTIDNNRYPVDTIIFGTGFRVTDLAVATWIYGRDGQSLAQAWQPGMRAYLGTTVTGFPNLFLILGPNTGLGHTSVLLMIESQVRHILALLRHLRRTGATTVEPTAAAMNQYNSIVDKRMRGTVWLSGCRSWYLDATGRNSTLWPGFVTSYRLRAHWLRRRDYRGAAT